MGDGRNTSFDILTSRQIGGTGLSQFLGENRLPIYDRGRVGWPVSVAICEGPTFRERPASAVRETPSVDRLVLRSTIPTE